MRETILKFAGVAWAAAKNPVGAAVIGGVSGSTATHLFNKSKLVADLELLQLDCSKLEEKISKLEDKNSQLSVRNDVLNDELRRADSRLSEQRFLASSAKIAYRNSWCIWRSHLETDQESLPHVNGSVTVPNSTIRSIP